MRLNHLFYLSIVLTTTLFAKLAKPTNLTLKALSSSKVAIGWKDNSDNETGFKIFRDGVLINITPANTTSFIDKNLLPNHTYSYTIKATNDKYSNNRKVFVTGENRSFIPYDDGATKRGIAHSYTKNSNTFTDNNTHLIWQNSSISYKNYDQAISYCQNLTIDGISGWRLPQMRELQTLIDLSHLGGGKYWSATEYPYNPNQMAYYIDFSNGFSAEYGSRDPFEKSNRYRVRCVKGEMISKGEFTRDDTTQTVTDKTTNLMWEDTAHIEQRLGVEDAINYCENLTLAGYDNWHLPNINEYYTIADRNHYDPAVNPIFLHRLTITDNNSNEHYRAANYWTSTYYGQHPDLPQVHYYRTFNERDGTSHRCRYYMGMHTRCVRNIK